MVRARLTLLASRLGSRRTVDDLPTVGMGWVGVLLLGCDRQKVFVLKAREMHVTQPVTSARTSQQAQSQSTSTNARRIYVTD
jgi:hypothetical protein